MKKISYVQFRSNTLQSLTLKGASRGMAGMSKDDLEKWVKSKYQSHYGKRAGQLVRKSDTKRIMK